MNLIPGMLESHPLYEYRKWSLLLVRKICLILMFVLAIIMIWHVKVKYQGSKPATPTSSRSEGRVIIWMKYQKVHP